MHLGVSDPTDSWVDIALHELTTNAVKHGALANHDGGKIAIGWELNGNGEGHSLNFEWVEKGTNGGIAEPSRHGFGMELLTRILPYDLGGKTSVEFLKSGLRFTMDMPIENVVD